MVKPKARVMNWDKDPRVMVYTGKIQCVRRTATKNTDDFITTEYLSFS